MYLIKQEGIRAAQSDEKDVAKQRRAAKSSRR
jgi:hypothetical protein